ncbi:D-alanyl-D-alanine carboxypeptidase/D-alanyl-D-alanine endopeptidase [Roseateles koreensis]|uniref:D-alanyl-D-alanine carboxypeptidase/D-alanyl-D-alanine-endopeptidase n=1 Tax=Roseateles koreensis TaxID=2987526 RepID=A0ABT5KUJ2_9BURK|nr:D-alanyl-D-alanine carboxypeptidase/D-alanyl-D-alanine-endopeptidase [Roseateles koreensis]MDC8786611.1 D-alanyl-D-alanine carboxypeptidase/D-alanyl-D-alanine-endopeptidase [Roseateles koreensis]
MARGLGAIVLSLALAGCALPPLQSPSAPHIALPPELAALLQQAQLPAESLGLVAVPLDQEQGGWRVQADVAFRPASTIKLLTALVALDQLGPNARGRTDLLTESEPQGDVLPGALYLRGGADTDLDWGALWWMLRQLREQGAREIRGGLVVDRTLFQPARPDLGAPPFDTTPEYAYNAIPDALGLNGNLVDLVLQADGDRLTARTSPAWTGLQVDSTAMRRVDRPCEDWAAGWQSPVIARRSLPPALESSASTSTGDVIVQLQGEFPRGCSASFTLNGVDRQWLTTQAVRQIWTALGGTLSGPVLEGATPPQAQVRVSHLSRPLADTLRQMLKQSDNALARQIYLQLGSGAEATAAPTTQAAADRTVRQWLARHQLDDRGLVLDNGSGLSRAERLTPALLAALLQQAWHGPHAPELLASLPVAGVDGTLRRRLKGTRAEGLARLKTGSLRDVAALAGFVDDSQGRPWVLVAIINDEQATAQGRAVLDAIVQWVGRQ